MSQQVIVDRDLLFRGAAEYQPNVKGRMMTELKINDYTFDRDASEYDFDEEEGNGATISHSAVDGGATIITGDDAATDDCAELSHTAQYSAASNCGMEVKAKISQLENIAIAIGFVDQKEADDDHIAGELTSGAVLRDPTNTEDAALFIFDTDAASNFWYGACINNNGIGTPVVTAGSLAPVANTYFKVRIQTDTGGNVTFYYNGVAVGYIPYTVDAEGVAKASTNLLTPYVGTIQRVKGAQVTTISRITVWQDN